MENIIIASYNNYFNRKVKRENSIADYVSAADYSEAIESINFNPADGITTKLVLGKGDLGEWELSSPDYLVVYNNEETILSRWFILDLYRSRGGQYELTLKRDVLADYEDSLVSSPIYVEKGIINDIESPLLCNNESLTVNQIKKEEILLKDKSLCPWLVMYLKKGVLGTSAVGDGGRITIDVPTDVAVYEELSTPITSWSLYQYTTTDYPVKDSNNVIVRFYVEGSIGTEYYYTMNSSTSSLVYKLQNPSSNLTVEETVNPTRTYKPLLDTAFRSRFSHLSNLISQELGLKGLTPLMEYDGKVIKDSTGKYYKVHIQNTGNNTSNTYNLTASTTKNAFNTAWNAATSQTQYGNDYAYQSKVTIVNYRIRLEELVDVETVVNFASYTGTGVVDNPLYDVICMPYGELTEFVGTEVSFETTTSADRSMKIMNSIATQLTSQWVLDLQLLPYCPLPAVLNDYYEEEGKIAILENMIDNNVLIASGTSISDVILVPTEVNFSMDLEYPVTITDNSDVPGSYITKYLNDCTLVRLCSPNYNGLFDFNLAKNGGSVEYFNVDVTLKPINPYIHINPNFKFLYGTDFNDVRGLVCGGDFSLGIVNDAWTQYEIQNKNYQAIFDRSIQNMDVNNSINKQEAIWQAGAGTLQGGMTGAAAGAMVGGGYGAAAGAAVSILSSGVGGVMDIANLQRRQQEARSYSIDNFNLQLGNVRALPNSITKTSCLTANNKLFPFVEIYECTDEEKEAYFNKLKYNGMTVGKIDFINNYLGDGDNYFQGRLVRGLNIKVDIHVLEEINNELMKGVYI